MLNPTDLRVLDSIQQDASLSAKQLGIKLGMSDSQARRRRQKLEAQGYIKKVTGQLTPDRVGLNVQAFLSVEAEFEKPSEMATFSDFIGGIPQVVGAWHLTGERNYFLRTFCKDITQLQHLVHNQLLCHKNVSRVHCNIVLSQTKLDSPLPLPNFVN